LFATLLVSVRIATATAFAPVFGPAKIPGPVKVLIAFSLAALMVSMRPAAQLQIQSMSELAIAAVREASIGLAFGFGFLAAYGATQVAGRALDVQIGFGAASILNPATQGLAPLLGSLFGMAMIAVFLAMDGHHLLIKALSISLEAMPPGATGELDVLLAIRQSAMVFAFGLTLAAPVMFSLWLADIAMAVFARSMPQLNVFVLSFAIKILLGTVGLALSLGLTRNLFADLFESTFRYWDRLSAG
jgi:flagellar biosynthetic protein FliR